MTAIPFVKTTACGNDFLIIDGIHAPADLCAFTRRICDRHFGIGADGVEWLFPASDADIRARLVNADGTEAEISGNGTRCVAAYLVSEQAKEKLIIRTGAGLKTCTLVAHNELTFEFDAAMGEAQIGEEFSIQLAFREVRGIPISMGNPHFVVFVDEFMPGWQAEAAEIGRHHDFKRGINVEFVVVRGESHIEIRLFERGVGETMSSGTGSCASAVAAIAGGEVHSPVHVQAPGGTQVVRWDGEVYLRGPAQILGRGEFFV
jgi:diaminopimelate epimerase